MVDGLGLLLVMIGMVMLIAWLLKNDKAAEGKTSGLFALREPGPGTGTERGKPRGQPGSPRLAARPAPAAAPHPAPAHAVARTDPRLPFQRD